MPPPRSLNAIRHAAGWRIPRLHTRQTRTARQALRVLMALWVAGLLLVVSLATEWEWSVWVWVGAMVGVTALAGAALGFLARNARTYRMELAPGHLILTQGRTGEAIDWSRVDAVRMLSDVRDSWDQAHDAAGDLQSLFGPEKRPPAALLIRWTENGRPAAHAHERTSWATHVVAVGASRKALRWLATEIEDRRSAAQDTAREKAFERAIRPGPVRL